MKLISIIKNVFIAARSAAVATATGTGTITNGDPNAKTMTYGTVPAHARSVTPMASMAIKGEITPEHLSMFRSNRAKQAVASLGCWSSLARAFSLFMKEHQVHPSRQNWDKVYNTLAEFHAWNAVCCEKSSGFFVRDNGEAYGENLGFAMSEEEVEITVAKLAILPMPKGDDKTDGILARVRGCSIDVLRKEREDDINQRSEKRLSLVQEFCQMVWASAGDDAMEVSMPVSKAIGKMAQTLQWVAGWKLDPASAASECLLLQDDIETLTKMVGHSSDDLRDRDPDTHFINGSLTADGMMRQSPF